jgi:murein L,D-transpeptidase YcbB/YkuD
MRFLTLTIGSLLFGHTLFAAPLREAQDGPSTISFQGFFQALLEKDPPSVSNQPLYSVSMIKQFYENRGYTPAWSHDGVLSEDALELLYSVQKADREGLKPEEYHLKTLERMVKEIRTDNERNRHVSPLKLFHVDLLMTDAFLTYGSHLLAGRIRPVDKDWFAHERNAHLPSLLEEAFRTRRVRDMLKSLLPTQSYYSRLRIALDRYRKIERDGGWESIEEGPVIKVGMSDERVPALRRRLSKEGDFRPTAASTGTVFDEALQRAIVSFQERHGLDADGALGKTTLEAMNVPVHRRVRQIVINMERCRWLPADMGSRYIVVNVANFSLDVIDQGETALDMRVVVGKPYRRTPVFSSTMTYLVLNPSWFVPKKIAGMDILDHIREEPDYLQKMGFTVYREGDENGKPVDPAGIDWSKYTLENLDYRFQQSPGEQNALGRIKFIFPNDFDVYLHDTPSRELFKKTVRDFSSGCIRVEKPLDLAVYVMQSSEWNRDTLQAALTKKQEKFLPLPNPIPVHLLYWTAWGDTKGRVQFRDDIYGRDEPLEQALKGALKDDQS